MDTHLLLESLRSYVDFPTVDFEAFLKLLLPFNLKKDDYFYKADEVPRYSPFLLKGCMRQFVVDERGQEQNIAFIEEGNWAGQIGSMRSRIATNVYLQALEPCEILGITIENVDIGMDHFPAYRQYFLNKYPRDHARMVEEAHRIKTESPEVLYLELLQHRPSLLLRVSQRHIANYLGIRTETISRIKSKLTGR